MTFSLKTRGNYDNSTVSGEIFGKFAAKCTPKTGAVNRLIQTKSCKPNYEKANYANRITQTERNDQPRETAVSRIPVRYPKKSRRKRGDSRNPFAKFLSSLLRARRCAKNA